MKLIPAFSAAAVLVVASCNTMDQSLSSGGFDPLRPPGSEIALGMPVGPAFKAGQFVRTVMDNSAFFKTRPKGDSDADKLLPRGTSMKVISIVDSYVKVELDSGDVGFVPTIMVEDPNAAPVGMTPANPGEFQVYPPLNGMTVPLPQVPSAEMPPDGAIPTVIDPDAPAATPPVPPVTAPNGAFPTPVEPNTGPAPLPPNGEELEAEKNNAGN